jgi:hypothetical protein
VGTDVNLASLLMQWGPLGVFAYLFWRAYEKVQSQARDDSKANLEGLQKSQQATQERLLDVVSQNSTAMAQSSAAMERMAHAVETNTAALDRFSGTVVNVEARLSVLEVQLGRNGRAEVH